MRHEFRLADIGEGLEEAEIISWLVSVGDRVSRDQPLIEVMTDKSNAELPAPAEGTIVELGGAVGDLIEVGDLIAVIESSDTGQPQAVSAVTAVTTVVADAPAAVVRVKAAPSTRRAAAERGIDLQTIVGTGPGGRILLTDLDTPAAVAHTPRLPA